MASDGFFLNQTDLVTPRSATYGDYFSHAAYIKPTTRITQIDIRYGSRINALYVTYSDGVNTDTISNGDTDPSFVGTYDSFTLDVDEYIVRVKGNFTDTTYETEVLKQLTFYTNKDNVYGPYGTEEGGNEFDISFPGDSKLLYFHGAASLSDIRTIGFGYGPGTASQVSVTRSELYGASSSTIDGLSGSSLGTTFDDSSAYFEGISRIAKIEVTVYGVQILALNVNYRNGRTIYHGYASSSSLFASNVISLDDDEFITGVSGTQSSQLNSISFQTNKQVYGPYGNISTGSSFTTSFDDGKALAYVFGRVTTSQILQLGFGSALLCAGPSVSVIKEKSRGVESGYLFDDMSHALAGRKITSITVCHGDVIHGIAVQYGYDSSNIETHGSTGVDGQTESIFEIGDDDNLIEIDGTFSTALTSLQFTLSSGKYSTVYGKPAKANLFSIGRSGCVISALHGQASESLNGIGAYTIGNAITEIVLSSISYSTDDLDIAQGDPFDAKVIILDNSSSSEQEISQTTEIEVSASTTVSSSFSFSTNAKVSYSAGFSFLKFSDSLNFPIGDSFEESFTPPSTITSTQMIGFTFTGKVNANSKVKAVAIARNVDFSIPWTLKANVYYLGQSKPVEMTIQGIYSGVRATAIGTTYEDLS